MRGVFCTAIRCAPIVTLLFLCVPLAESDLVFDEDALLLAIAKWPLRDGAGVRTISDHLCDFVMADADLFFRVMSNHRAVFAEWLVGLDTSFTDFGGCPCIEQLQCKRRVMLDALSRVPRDELFSDLVASLRERLEGLEVQVVD